MNRRRPPNERYPSEPRWEERGPSSRSGAPGRTEYGSDYQRRASEQFGGSPRGRRDYEEYDRSRSRSPSYRGGETGRGYEDARYGRYNEEERLGEASRGRGGGRPRGREEYEERPPRGPYRHEKEQYGGGQQVPHRGRDEGGRRGERPPQRGPQQQGPERPWEPGRGGVGQRGYNPQQEAFRNRRDTRRSGSFRNEDEQDRDDEMDSHGRY